MTQHSYEVGELQFDRSEMFAIGAAAGAVITAAISEYLERRRPKTAWEKAQERSADALNAVTGSAKRSTKLAKGYVDVASDYVQDVLDSAPKTWQQTKKQTKKNAKKQRKQASKQVTGLKEAAVAALGVSAASSVVDKVRDYATSTTASIAGDPYAVSGSIKETLKERYDSARSIAGDGKLTELGGTAIETLKSVASTAAETVKDYSTTARETIKDAELGEKAKDYAAAATVALAAYSTQASQATRKAAQQSATKLTESASHLAEVTSDQASGLRKGVQKGVKRTRRRARWGLRAFIIGLVIGFLSAPQSGQRTRDAAISFIENILDVLMPDTPRGNSASL